MKYLFAFIAMVLFLTAIVIASANIYHKRDVHNCMVEGGTKASCEAKFK